MTTASARFFGTLSFALAGATAAFFGFDLLGVWDISEPKSAGIIAVSCVTAAVSLATLALASVGKDRTIS